MSPKERALVASRRAAKRIQEEKEAYEKSREAGTLASSSAFGRELARPPGQLQVEEELKFITRVPSQMEQALNPRPVARLRWQRKMVIREVRHRGRLNREMRIARTERKHVSRSHFFKTSMKKLAPLARQIAGKSIDEAILQMRFSNKKAAQEVRQHLVQARNEAIVVKGMGLGGVSQDKDKDGGDKDKDKGEEKKEVDLQSDPSEKPPSPYRTPMLTYRKGHAPNETDIYVAEAWVNRGPYGQEPEFRARGRMNMMRPPYTGISVMLKEEKTRTRQKAEKEAKALRKRMGKNMWVHLPDRKVTTQRQHVLW